MGIKVRGKQTAAQAAHYQANKEVYKARTAIRNIATRKRNVEHLIAAKQGMPCMDCEVSYPSPIMQFHHRVPSEKRSGVSKLVWNLASLKVIDAEINKCDLLCSNCHILRHIEDGTVGRNKAATIVVM